MRYLAGVVTHDVTSHTDISHIIEPHIGGDLAEKPPLRMSEQFLTPDLSISGNFEQPLVLVAEKPPPLFCLLVRYSAHVVTHDVTSCTNSSHIIEPHIGGGLAEKPPPPRMRENF